MKPFKNLFALVVMLLMNMLCIAQSNVFPSSGNVGVGTTNPIDKLHVNGVIRWGGDATNYAFSGEDGWGMYIEQVGEIPDRSAIRLQASKSKDFSNYSQLFIDPYNGFSFRGLGNANSNVGIGTRYPSTLLHVDGAPIQNWLTSFLNTGEFGHKIYMGYSNGTNTNHGLYIQGGRGDASQIDLAVENKFYVMGNGNVGVGTSTASDKFAVNGNIRAREVKVENNNWPDYVFNQSYLLRPLSEVELFIKRNHHLPGMPAAAQVSRDGINLSEMNAKLLEKIEELTLYVIDLKNEVESLKNKESQTTKKKKARKISMN